MLLDGMPGMMGMGIIPENWVGRLDVITGPNIVLSGAQALSKVRLVLLTMYLKSRG